MLSIAVVPGLASALFPVLNRFNRAAANTGHAMGTILPPHRLPILQGDIIQGTKLCAFPAAHTLITGIKSIGFHKQTIEYGVDGTV